MIDEVLARLPENYPAKIADIGTGSGIIAITLKLERLLNHVFASDLSASALNVACLNAKDLHADVVFTQGSWFEGLDQIEQGSDFDFIVSNPPYIEKNDPHLQQGDVRFEPQMALTDFADGLEAYRVLTDQSYSRLKDNGWLIMEHGYDQGQAIRYLSRPMCPAASAMPAARRCTPPFRMYSNCRPYRTIWQAAMHWSTISMPAPPLAGT